MLVVEILLKSLILSNKIPCLSTHLFTHFLATKHNNLELIFEKLKSLNPENKILTNSAQIVKNNQGTSLNKIKLHESFVLVDTTTKITAKRIK